MEKSRVKLDPIQLTRPNRELEELRKPLSKDHHDDEHQSAELWTRRFAASGKKEI